MVKFIRDIDSTRRALLEALEDANMTRRDLAKAVDVNPAYFSDFVNRGSPKHLPIDIAVRVADAMNLPFYTFFPPEIGGAIAEAAGDRDAAASIRRVDTSEDDEDGSVFNIPEIDAQAGAGAGGFDIEETETGSWRIPAAFVRHELHARPENLRLVRAQGDSMEPTIRSGSRLLVDIKNRKPSPPGIFCLFDGIGLIVKHVEFIPNSDRIYISSSNQVYRSFEMTADEAHIIGRVVAATLPL